MDLLKPEYNILKIAGSSLGFKHTEETMAILKGRKHSPEIIAKNLTAERKAEHLAHLNRLNLSGNHLEQLKGIHADAEIQGKRLDSLNIYNSSEKHKEHLKNLHANLEFKVKRLEQLKKANVIPSHRVSVLDSLNNQTTVYPSIGKAALAIGMGQSSISEAFKKKGESTI